MRSYARGMARRTPRRWGWRLVGALAALVATARGGAATDGARVTVFDEATVDAPTVRLGAIARLEGAAAEALGEVALAGAPAAGGERLLDGAGILAALRAAGGDDAAGTYTDPPARRVRGAAPEGSAGPPRPRGEVRASPRA